MNKAPRPPPKDPPMTNATDAMTSQYMADVVQAAIECLCANGFQSRTHRLTEVRDRLRATPAGSASGEVQRYFRGEYGMVAAGPEYPHRDGDTYWVAEQDYAALQAEVAGLWENFRESVNETQDALIRAEAAEAEAARLREDAARLDWAQQHAHMLTWTDEGDPLVIRADDGAEFTGETLRAAIDAAMGSANGQG